MSWRRLRKDVFSEFREINSYYITREIKPSFYYPCSIYESRSTKFCQPRPAKTQGCEIIFNWHTRVINRRILYPSDIQSFMFRGSFVAFSWSKNGALKFEYFNYIRFRIFFIYILKLKLYSLHFTSSFTSFKKCCSICNYNFSITEKQDGVPEQVE